MLEWTNEAKIGEPGGFGVVYKSRKKMGKIIGTKEFAKKILVVEDEDSIERFKKEVRLTKRLNHPNVVEIIDENLNIKPYFYIMQLYEYSMLEKIYDLKYDYLKLREVFNSICDGVEYLHDEGVLHRDLKPGNILMNSNNDLVIADLGLGVQTTSESERFTATGIYMGTSFYTAPEQKDDSKNVNNRADIYSLGCIIYQIVVEKFNYILDYSKIPVCFEYVIKKSTQVNKDDRFESVENLRKAFNSAIDMVTEEYDKSFGEEIIIKLNSGIIDPDFVARMCGYIEEHIDDADYIHDIIMNLNQEQFNILEENHIELTKKIVKQFKVNIISQGWGFSYTDTIGRQCDKLIKASHDEEVTTNLIITLVQVGSYHNRWYVMNLARIALYNIDNQVLALMLEDELEQYRWEMEHLDLDSKALISPLKKFVV